MKTDPVAVLSDLHDAADAVLAVFDDLVGWGPQESEVRALISELNVDELVRFEPALQYGEAFHAKLREYDALLFTPTEEDTPRMGYDVYAASAISARAPGRSLRCTRIARASSRSRARPAKRAAITPSSTGTAAAWSGPSMP